MCEIIFLNKYQNRKQQKTDCPNYSSNEELATPFEQMASQVSDLFNNKSMIEALEKGESEIRKEFEEKYKHVLSHAPAPAEAQIQYFAGIMLEFLSDIFRDQAGRSDAYWDFIEFYISEFNTAYSNFHIDNKHSLEKEYPFRCTHLTADELKAGLQDCLIRLKNPKKNGRKQEEEIIRQSCRLFELEHCLSDWFDKVSDN